MSSIKSTITQNCLTNQNGFLPAPPQPQPNNRPPAPPSHPQPARAPSSPSNQANAVTSSSIPALSQSSPYLGVPDGLEMFANGDIAVDPSAAGGVGSAKAEESGEDEAKADAKGKAKGKGKGKGQGARKPAKRPAEPDDLKPPKKTKLKFDKLPLPDPILDAHEQDQLALQLHTTPTVQPPAVGDTFDSIAALQGAIAFWQSARGHDIRLISTYVERKGENRSPQWHTYGCKHSSPKAKEATALSSCTMRVQCEPVFAPDGTRTGRMRIRTITGEHTHLPQRSKSEVLAAGFGRRMGSVPSVPRAAQPDVGQAAVAGQGSSFKLEGAGRTVGERVEVRGAELPLRPGPGRGKTIPAQKTPAPEEEDGNSSGSDTYDRAFADMPNSPTPAQQFNFNRVPSPLTPPAASSVASSSSSSPASQASSVGSIVGALIEPDPNQPFNTYGMPMFLHKPIEECSTQEAYERLVGTPAAATEASSSSPPGRLPFPFDSPNSIRTGDTAATSPPTPNFPGGGENPNGLVNLGGLEPEVGTTDLITPLQATLADASSNGGAPDSSATGAFNFDLPGLPLFQPSLLPGPDKTPLSKDELEKVLAELEPGLETLVGVLHSPAGMEIDTVGRANAFLHELKPAEIEAAMGATLAGTSLNGRNAGQILARAVEGKRVAKGLEEGLGGGVQV